MQEFVQAKIAWNPKTERVSLAMTEKTEFSTLRQASEHRVGPREGYET